LGCKKLCLGAPARKLTVGHHHGRLGDLSGSFGCARIAGRSRSSPQGLARLLERAFGVLGVFACFELAEPVLKLCGLRLRARLLC